MKLLLRMLRGDYAVRVDVENRTTTRLIWTKIDWKQIIVTRRHHVLVTVDTDAHVVHSSAEGPVSRESWLAILRQHRPELIDKVSVKTAAHTRHLSSGKEITINPYDLTVYRRKDKKRKQRMVVNSLKG